METKKIKQIKSKIVKILKQNNVVRAGIFGSYARGEEKKDSDIDILVEIDDKDLSLLGFIRLGRELGEALRKKVDLVEYKVIKPRIRENILNSEVRII